MMEHLIIMAYFLRMYAKYCPDTNEWNLFGYLDRVIRNSRFFLLPKNVKIVYVFKK